VPLQQAAKEKEEQEEDEAINHNTHLLGTTPSSRTCTQHIAGDNVASKQLTLYSFQHSIS
jgi:hypothetical protein